MIKNLNFALSSIIGLFFIFNSQAQTGQTTFNDPTANGTAANDWICPAGITCVRVYTVGAGGGGGGNDTNADGAGAGGGGGYREALITVIPGNTYAVNVGAGGAGSLTAGTGADGGDSWFGSTTTIRSNGGSGGAAPNSGAGGLGGNGGGPGVTSGTPVSSFAGGDGGNGVNNNSGGGGGGGASASNAGAGANGANGTSGTGGAGALSGWTSFAGDGGSGNNDGFNGTFPGNGGGGSGERISNSFDSWGGDGADGLVVVIADRCITNTTLLPATAQSICQGEAVTGITAVDDAVSGCTSLPVIQYQWYSNTTNSNNIASSTLIPGATFVSYTPSSATIGTTYYFCVAYIPGAPCFQTSTTQSLASPTVQIDITAGPCTVPEYLHPTAGLLGSFSGACPVSTDNGTYLDDGGATGDYSHNINSIYRTFCPTTEGTCVNLEFTSFETANSNDYLLIQNGPAQNSPVIGGSLWGALATPFSYQSTNSSGCLTVRYTTNGPTLTDPGWAATITNVACTEAQPVGNSDCSSATAICSNTTFNDVSNGPGLNTDEGCDACLTGESYSNWYTFTISSSGTLGLTITPNAVADYDFTLYQGSCGGAMSRCSFSGNTGNTGLGNGALDTSEDANGDSFVSTLNVTAGETYYLLVNSWTAGGPGFDLIWNLTNGASLDCSVLPVELTTFETTYSPEVKGTDLHWITESERNSDYFTIEKSKDGVNFTALFDVKAAGTTTEMTEYFAFDANVDLGYTYYRLKQTDFDGNIEYSEIRVVQAYSDELDQLTVTPNPTVGKTSIFFNNYKSEECTLNITSIRGEVVHSETFKGLKGGNNINVDLSQYEKGIYLVNVITGNKSYKEKLVIQ